MYEMLLYTREIFLHTVVCVCEREREESVCDSAREWVRVSESEKVSPCGSPCGRLRREICVCVCERKRRVRACVCM